MAGQPIRRQLHVDIVEAGGLPYILGEIAQGRTMTDLARQFGVGLWSMDRWVYRHTKGTTLLADARKIAAGALAGQVLKIADESFPENERVSRLKIDSRKWLAAKLDPAGYGEQQAGAAIQINVGDMHLLALRQVQGGTAAAVDVAQAHQTIEAQAIDATPAAPRAKKALPAPVVADGPDAAPGPDVSEYLGAPVPDDTDDEYDALEATWAQEASRLKSLTAMRAAGAVQHVGTKIEAPVVEKTEALTAKKSDEADLLADMLMGL